MPYASELRARARAQLGGGIFQTQWMLTLVVCFLYDLLLSAAGSLSFFVGTILLAGALEYGLCRVLVSSVRGKSVDINDMFKGFSEDFTNTLLLGLMKSIFLFLWSLLFVIPGIVKSYSYAMSTYIQQDSPNKDWQYCLDESRRVMNGRKWNLFCLDLSFIGWYLVGYLCCGIGILFVIPYHQQARANFYEVIRKAECGEADAEAA